VQRPHYALLYYSFSLLTYRARVLYTRIYYYHPIPLGSRNACVSTSTARLQRRLVYVSLCILQPFQTLCKSHKLRDTSYYYCTAAAAAATIICATCTWLLFGLVCFCSLPRDDHCCSSGDRTRSIHYNK